MTRKKKLVEARMLGREQGEDGLAQRGGGAMLWRYAAGAVRGVVMPACDAECGIVLAQSNDT
jgi:hypothetical protein